MHRRYTLTRLIVACIVILMLVCVAAQARIVFASNRDGNWEIYVMDTNGNNQRNLTNHPKNDEDPSGAPDGKRIAFMSNRDGHVVKGNITDEIYVMDADGNNPQNLTNHLHNDRHPSWFPSWSPDGQQIVFTSIGEDWSEQIYVMDADGKNQQRLSNHPDRDFTPSWFRSPFSVSTAGKQFTRWGRLKQVDR